MRERQRMKQRVDRVKAANKGVKTREQLLREITALARQAIYGTLSETYRACGNPRCRCHHGGPKHGPHLYVSHRGKSGKTTGYYVPRRVEVEVRRGVASWAELQERVRRLAELNKERVIATKPKNQPPFRNRL